jgi:hypothetical protein
MVTMNGTLSADDLVGVREIADRLSVPRTTASMWIQRAASNGFPAPVKRLAMGPVFDWPAVLAWHQASER